MCSSLKNYQKKILFYVIVLLLCLPIVQQKEKFISTKPLHGSFYNMDPLAISFKNWFNGTYPKHTEKYLNENFGFRSFFVRIYNQLQYSLFKKAKANGVIIGKENYLYEENYILSYLGRDFIGEEKIIKKVEKLKKICDTLGSKSIEIIVLLAPGKGSFYPEYIPEKYNPSNLHRTNYEVYKNLIQQEGIHLLDFQSWFLQMKHASKHPLFPKTGIHWSKYGEFLVADSILNYINHNTSKKLYSKILLTKMNESNKPLDTDDDIENGMNLLFNIKDLKMGYPEVQFEISRDTPASKVLVVADSYYWGLFNSGISRDIFNNGEFWFYNKQIYPHSYTAPLNVEDVNLKAHIETNDIIILLSTDANLPKFAFGFIDQVYDLYFN
ncbi:MAG: hypothetical protein CMP62_01420 [Flavobacteriales bacterium]|nr:hypothetical protein [Flavobacteriales bacterium]|tara:strand:+ start:4804 stop:5949 length:1146 start_codon:yes stop_codon:yes gene_type:complete